MFALLSWRRSAARRLAASLIVAVSLPIASAVAQEEGSSGQGGRDVRTEAKPFQLYRWKEDYSYLAGKPQLSTWERLKYIPIAQSPEVWLSLGGEARYRLDRYAPYLFGLGKSGFDWASHQERMFQHFDLHLGRTFRTFVQFDAAYEDGRPVQRAYDQSRPDVRQAFVDVVLPMGPGNVMLRAGREELYLGDSRWLAVRDPTNLRRSFNGLLAEYDDPSLTLRVFAANPVNIQSGTFDDNTLGSEFFRGAYAVVREPLALPLTLDAYVYGRQQASVTYARGMAPEDRWSGGARVAARHRGFELTSEATYQWGSFGTSSISAFGAFGDFGYRFPRLDIFGQSAAPKLGLRTHYASGDDNLKGTTLHTFAGAYPAASVISEMSLLSASNVTNLQPYGHLFITSGLVLGANWNFVRKATTADAVYGPIGTQITAKGSASLDVAQIGQIDMTWTINRFLQLHALYAHVYAGDYIRAAGGRDFDYYRLQLMARW
ncbi:alginate export family protein [Bradyrhizobium sp. TM233]|uniref:alginate export family protein n=1 Tax=Bradyrhizobium sp. TM233 TaxID=2599801 RepID=UPI0030C70E91